MINGKRCILIVDDEERIVRALSDVLSVKGFHVLKAYNGEEALRLHFDNASGIDLILLDVMLPLKSGLEVLTEIRRNGSLTPVILLTARGEEYDQVNGFRLGADDYIVKPFSPTLLISRIEAVLRRVGKGGDGVLTDGYISVNMLTHEVKCADKQVELTRREFDLLCFFMTNARLTLTRTQLLNSVWGVNFDGDERTVDTHIKQLRSKLGVDGCIKTVYRVGYKFDARTNPTDSNCF